MKQIFSTNTLLITFLVVLACLVGFALGLRYGYMDGSQHTTEIRNQMLDIKPYDASLQIKDLEYSDISPAGFTIYFDTKDTTGNVISSDDINDLVVQWTVYPSDVFSTSNVLIGLLHRPSLKATIETYPEGGTVMFRIIDANFPQVNYGSSWFYIDLPRPDESVLPPPYMPTEAR